MGDSLVFDVEGVEPVDEATAVGGGQDEVGGEGFDFVQVGVLDGPDGFDLFQAGQIIGKLGSADEAVFHAQGADDFGNTGGQGEDTLWAVVFFGGDNRWMQDVVGGLGGVGMIYCFLRGKMVFVLMQTIADAQADGGDENKRHNGDQYVRAFGFQAVRIAFL